MDGAVLNITQKNAAGMEEIVLLSTSIQTARYLFHHC